jgi:hypothetical protein
VARRHESLRRTAAVLGLIAATGHGSGCAPRAATGRQDEVIAVEATFGGTWCRRIEDPAVVAELVSARRELEGGFQAAWTPLPEPGLYLVFLGTGGELQRLGVGDGQAQTLADGRQLFQPIDGATAARLVDLAGGPPVGPPDRPCVAFAAPAAEKDA